MSLTGDLICKMIAIVCFIFLGCLGIKVFRSSRQEKLDALEELETAYTEPELSEVHACLQKKECGVKMYGTKTPETRKLFYFTFLTDANEQLRYEIDEEIYHTFDEGQSGTLAIANDNFYGFVTEN